MDDVQIGDHFTIHEDWFNSIVARNFYYSGGDKRLVNGKATAIYQDSDGAIRLRTANSGNAGDAITWKIGLIVRNDDPQDLPRVGIGTEFPQHRLDVDGTIRSCESIVELFGTCDYVFEEDHQRMTFEDRKLFYTKNKHLPMIEPGQLIEQNGLNIGNTINGLVFNLEEFGLNQLDLYDGQEELKQTVKEQEETIEELKKRMKELEKKLDEINK